MANKRQTFISSIKNDRLQPSVTKAILKTIEGQNGKKFVITIEKLSAKRSLQQNAYIHVLFTEFKEGLNDLGNDYTMEQVKMLCKLKFALKDMVDMSTGEVIGQEIQHTSDMTKEEVSIFIEKTINWAREFFNIKLFFPNEQLTID
jgi:hypothetical protein